MVKGKYVSTEKLDYVCENSQFCNKNSPSNGTLECGLDGRWEDAPVCNETAIMKEGLLFLSGLKISLLNKNLKH